MAIHKGSIWLESNPPSQGGRWYAATSIGVIANDTSLEHLFSNIISQGVNLDEVAITYIYADDEIVQ